MRRVYVIADLEGVAGMSDFDHRDDRVPGLVWRRDRGLSLWAEEVNAAVAGAREAGAADVLVLDNHGPGDGLPAHDMRPPARLIHGRSRTTWLPCLDDSSDAVIFVGQHAMAGTPEGHLCHTYSRRRLRSVRLNGAEIGEIGIAGAIAGEHGVPVAFLSGDDKAVEELGSVCPQAEGVAVKQGLSRLSCVSMPPSQARDAIRTGVARALSRVEAMAPVIGPRPARISLQYATRDAWRAPMRMLRSCFCERWVGWGRVVVRGETVQEAWDRAIGLRRG
ncbi:M55 family metallopeptidase [Candidatus Latescibacterota bacterium]